VSIAAERESWLLEHERLQDHVHACVLPSESVPKSDAFAPTRRVTEELNA
jgi:hypothetical protein